MYIDIGWLFSALLWAGFTALWGWMTYIFCMGATDVGLAGLIGMCAVSAIVSISNFACCFWRDDDDE